LIQVKIKGLIYFFGKTMKLFYPIYNSIVTINIVNRIFFLRKVSFFAFFSTIFLAPTDYAIGQTLSSHYEISQVKFAYGGGQSDDLPDLAMLEDVEIKLSRKTFTVSNLSSGLDESLKLSLQELQEIAQLPVQYLKSLGYEGLVAFPDPNQIDPITGKDLRRPSDLSIRIVVWVSRVEPVEFLNNGINEKIFKNLSAQGQERFANKEELGKPLTNAQLRYWKRYGSLYSRSAVTNLTAGENPGQVVPLVKLGLTKKQGGNIYATNAGTETTGKWIVGGAYFYNQISERDDDVQFSYLASDTRERQSLNLKYTVPLEAPQILSLDVQAGYSSYDASSFALTRIDFEGETRSLDLSLRWNPLEWEHENYQFGFEFGLRGEKVEAQNSLINGRADADMLTPRMALRLDTKGTYVRTMTKVEIRRNVLNISEVDRSLLGGVGVTDQSTRLKVNYMDSLKVGKWLRDHLYSDLPPHCDRHLIVSKVSADLGLENKRHLPQHQFISGGSGSVRGYPESPIAGDHGYNISVEYRIPFASGDAGPGLGRVSSTLIPFLDWAETFVTEPLSYESDRSILGSGVGLEMKFSKGLQARLDFAKPLREIKNGGTIVDGTRSSDNRVHALVVWEF
jgi:hemolysin activation/secretion protein